MSIPDVKSMKALTDNRLIIILIALCLVSYCRTFDVPFMFDDFDCIANNPFIRDFGNLFNKSAALQTYAANPGVLQDTLNNFITRPMSYLTFAIDYYIHGKTVAGYHLVNTFIHTLNVVIVYLLVRVSIRTLSEKNNQNPNALPTADAIRIAFVTAALFAVHPLMTNAVTYIIQRMTSLVALCYLAGLLFYAYFCSSHNQSRKALFYGFSLFSCCAGMLTKETAFTLPAMLLLYDMVFCRGELRTRIIRLTPFLLTMVIIPYNLIGLSNSEASQVGGVLSPSLNLINFSNVSSWEYLLTQFRAIAFYLHLLLMPVGLSLEHGFRVSHSLGEPTVILSLLLHLSLVGYASYLLWSSRNSCKPCTIDALAGFGILWFYITLSVESSIIPLNEMAVEHRTYLPSLGIFLFATCLVHKLVDKYSSAGNGLKAEYFIWIPVISMLMYLTMMRNEVWRKPDEFWKQTISLYPKLARPYANLADYHINRGALGDAIAVYSWSIQEMPYEPVLHYELGNVFLLAKDYQAGIHELIQAIRMKPDLRKAYDSLAKAYLYSGRPELAYETLDSANRLSPGLPPGGLPGGTP